MIKKIFLKFFIFFSSSILFFVLGEFFIRLTNLDIKIIKTNLYYQDENLALFQPSKNVKKIFEMIPNQKISIMGRDFEINNFGFRDKKRELDKGDKYRIIVVGDSNTFGQNVKDDETYTRLLEEKLNVKHGGKFEIWNAGIPAQALSQKIETAEEMISKYNPNLLIIQDNNGERRSFLANQELEYYFKNNPEIFRENIPLIFNDNVKFLKFHYYFVDHLSIYRFIMASVNNYIIVPKIREAQEKMKSGLTYTKSHFPIQGFNDYSNERNIRDFDNFLARHKDRKIIIFDSLSELYCNGGRGITRHGVINNAEQYQNLDYFSLCNHNEKLDIYLDSHPPPEAYEWYADELIKMLEQKGYI
jgi:hypothetical protein